MLNLSDAMQYGVKLLIGLVLLIFLFRIMGNKELAQSTPLDLAFVVILADIVSGAIVDDTLSWLHILFLSISWAFLIYLLKFFTKRFRRVFRVLNGDRKILVYHGEIHEDMLKKVRLSKIELLSQLRLKGYFSLDDIELVYLEPNGELSIKPKESE